MEKELADLRASGATKVSFLDAGCGPVPGYADWSLAHSRSDFAASLRADLT
jgi:hypothetical protein